MGDTLGIFEDDQDAARFENAIRLLGEVPTRSNPSGEGGLAGHPLLRGISGIDEIILRVNIAVFGTESIRITGCDELLSACECEGGEDED